MAESIRPGEGSSRGILNVIKEQIYRLFPNDKTLRAEWADEVIVQPGVDGSSPEKAISFKQEVPIGRFEDVQNFLARLGEGWAISHDVIDNPNWKVYLKLNGTQVYEVAKNGMAITVKKAPAA